MSNPCPACGVSTDVSDVPRASKRVGAKPALGCLVCGYKNQIKNYLNTIEEQGNELHDADVRIAQLEAIVGKLPRDANGVPVVAWVDDMFCVDEFGVQRAAWYTLKLTNTRTGEILPASQCYSTHKAAEAVRKDDQ